MSVPDNTADYRRADIAGIRCDTTASPVLSRRRKCEVHGCDSPPAWQLRCWMANGTLQSTDVCATDLVEFGPAIVALQRSHEVSDAYAVPFAVQGQLL